MLFESVFSGIWRSFYSADAYRGVATGRTLHCTLLLGVVVLVLAFATSAKLAVELRGVGVDFSASLAGAPDIHLVNGEARLDPPGRWVGTLEGNEFLVFDTELPLEEAMSAEQGIFLTRTHLVVRQKNRADTRNLELAQLGDRVIKQQDLRRWVKLLFDWLPWVVLPFIAVFSWLWRSALAAALAVAGIPLGGALGVQLDYAASFRIATLAIIPTLVIGLAADLAGRAALWTWWASVLVTLGYFAFGVHAQRGGTPLEGAGLTPPPTRVG